MDGGKFRDTMHSLNYGTVMEAAARDYMKEKMRDESTARAMGKARAMDARDLFEVRELGSGGEMRASCRVSRVACGFERRSRRDAGEEMRVDSRLDRRRRRGARATDAPFRFVDAMGWDA